jgi:hypothetical protein
MDEGTIALLIAVVSLGGTVAVAVLNTVNQRGLAQLQTDGQRQLSRLQGAREIDRPLTEGVSSIRLQEYPKVPAMLHRLSRMMPPPGPEDARTIYNDLMEWRYGPACMVVSPSVSRALVALLERLRARYKEAEYIAQLRRSGYEGPEFRNVGKDYDATDVESAIRAFEFSSMAKLQDAKDHMLRALRSDLLIRSEDAVWARFLPSHGDLTVIRSGACGVSIAWDEIDWFESSKKVDFASLTLDQVTMTRLRDGVDQAVGEIEEPWRLKEK